MANAGAMVSDASLALAAAATALAVTGVAAVLRGGGGGGGAGRGALAALFLLIGLLTLPPMVQRLWPAGLTANMVVMLPALMALPPTLGLYVREMTGARGRPNGARMITPFVPALTGLGVAAAFGLAPAPMARSMLVDGVLAPGGFAAALALLAFIHILGWPILAIWQFVRISRDFARYRAHLRNQYSNVERLELRWLAGFGWMVAGVGALFAASLLADNLIGRSILTVESALVLAILLLAFLTIWALRTAPDTARTDDPPVPEKYARSALTDDQAQRIAAKIQGAMERDTLYLDPALSLQKLSRHLGVSANLVSQVLNERIGESFFDHVNRWRIEAAIPGIVANERSVLEVALAVGFNTRSTFYKAFKTVTGDAPDAYRRRYPATHSTFVSLKSTTSASSHTLG